MAGEKCFKRPKVDAPHGEVSAGERPVDEVSVGRLAAGCELESRCSSAGRKLDACLRGTVKLRRAHGGCLGSQRRRRTWTAAKSFGEPLTGFDPEISEWGNPRRDYLPASGEYIAVWQPSQGTETSKYLDERK